MANESPPPFVPFAPNFQPPVQAPPASDAVAQSLPKETKKQREKREAAERRAAKAAEAKLEQVPNKPPKPPRRTRSAKPAKRTAKYDLQTILKIASTIKEADQPVFEDLLGRLTSLPKGSRERVLKALNEVFG